MNIPVETPLCQREFGGRTSALRRTGGRFRTVMQDLFDLLHPGACLICTQPMRNMGEPLCGDCCRHLRLVTHPCLTCDGEPEDPLRIPCPLCTGGRRVDLPLRHAGWHEGTLRELILRVKWHGNRAALPLLARWTASSVQAGGWLRGCHGWVPVPRDPWRWLSRGIPLAEYLGSEMARVLSLDRLPAPRRRVRPPQTALGQRERQRNLAGAFQYSARRARRLRGKRVLLVDDVLTTGATLRECAHALRRAGVQEVRCVVISAAP